MADSNIIILDEERRKRRRFSEWLSEQETLQDAIHALPIVIAFFALISFFVWLKGMM